MKLIYLSLFLSVPCNAAAYKSFYLLNGKEVSSEQAILASLKGLDTYRCVSVEAKVSKAGTSIGMRQVKKPVGGSK